MGLFDWLRRRDAGEENPTLSFDTHEQTFEGLDMKGALDAHMQWRDRLTRHLSGASSENFDIPGVACDDRCALGQWIHSTARHKYAHLPEFERLRGVHADFHLCAGDILLKNDNGDKPEAESLLRNEFKKLSQQVQLELVRLHSKASR